MLEELLDEELRRERAWLLRREPDFEVRLPVLDREPPERAPPERAEVERRARPEPEELARDEPLELARDEPPLELARDEPPEELAAPFFAPCIAPRAAAAATSPAFSSPARPYTAPRRKSSLARGETAAAVAAAIAPASRSM